MKKAIGIILLVIVGLNFITLFYRVQNEDSLGSPLYFAILSLMLIIGLILLLQSKETKTKSNSTITNSGIGSKLNNEKVEDSLKKEENKNNQLLKEVDLQEDELQKLKLHNLLTEEEFNVKREIVLKRKEAIVQELDKIKLEQELERVKSLVNDQIKPQLLLLENTFKSELLTQEEFDTKKSQLFNERYNSIFMLLFQDPKFQLNLEVINENGLKGYDQYDINVSLPKFKFGNIVLFNKREKKLRIFSFNEFLEINNSQYSSKYSYVNIPNFLNRIGYPQLQKKINNKSF